MSRMSATAMLLRFGSFRFRNITSQQLCRHQVTRQLSVSELKARPSAILSLQLSQNTALMP
jgi:hypothetical protein